MSNPDQSLYRDPHTGRGIPLTDLSRIEGASFLIHECGYDRGTFDWNFRNVASPFWRLYYNPKPGNGVRWRGGRIPLDGRHLLLIPENLGFDCQGPRRVPHLWLHFNFSSYIELDQQVPVSIPLNPVIQGLLRSVIQGLNQPVPLRLAHWCAALLHASAALTPARPGPVLPSELRDLLHFIHGSIGIKLPNTLLARRVGRSTEGFVRWFRHHVRQTPAEYVQRTRLARAAQQLIFTNQSVEEIAAGTGFPNRHYFSRAFAQAHGCGPATFRRERGTGRIWAQ